MTRFSVPNDVRLDPRPIRALYSARPAESIIHYENFARPFGAVSRRLRNSLRWCFETVALATPLTRISTPAVAIGAPATRRYSSSGYQNTTTVVNLPEFDKQWL